MKQIVEDKSQLILTILALMAAMFAIGQNFTEGNARSRERQDMALIIDAKVAAGIAEAKQTMNEQLAKAQADMHLANTNSMLAKERMDRAVAQLEARGLIKPETH